MASLLLTVNLMTFYMQCCKHAMRAWMRNKANVIIDRLIEEIMD